MSYPVHGTITPAHPGFRPTVRLDEYELDQAFRDYNQRYPATPSTPHLSKSDIAGGVAGLIGVALVGGIVYAMCKSAFGRLILLGAGCWLIWIVWSSQPHAGVGSQATVSEPSATPQFVQPLPNGELLTVYLSSAPRGIAAIIKGSVETYNDLPHNAEEGDCWFVTAQSRFANQYVTFVNNEWISTHLER
jgi:hypothetical protein